MSESEKCVRKFVEQLDSVPASVFSQPWVASLFNVDNNLFHLWTQTVQFLPEDFLSKEYTRKELKKIVSVGIRKMYPTLAEDKLEAEVKKQLAVFSTWKRGIDI